MIKLSGFAFAMAMVVMGAAHAKDSKDAVVADTAEKFAPLEQKIRHEMEAGGRYEFISAHDRDSVNENLDAMAALLGKSGSVASMNEADKTRLFNLQEQVNGALAQNASDRLICERVAPVGSHLPVKTCRTYGEIVRNRQNTEQFRKEMDDRSRASNAVGLGGR